MKAAPDCLPCLLTRVLGTARRISPDVWLQRKVLTEAMTRLAAQDLDQPPAALLRESLKLATKAANDWKDDAAKAKVHAMKTARSDALAAYGGESWVMNKAIHYNGWADFSKAEFKPVVAAFKTLLLQFRCPKQECDSWLYVTPRKGDPEMLRCRCMGVNLNLKPK